MKIHFSLFFFLFILFYAQNTFAQTEKLSRSEMQRDINYLARYITYLHPTVGVNIERAQVEQWKSTIQAGLPQEANKVQFLSLIDPLIDSLKCGHTGFLPDRRMTDVKTSSEMIGFIPLKVKQFEDKVIITQNLSPDSLLIEDGYEILAVNGVETFDILEQLRRLRVGSDGNNKTGEAYFSTLLFPYAFNMLFGKPDTFEIKVQNLEVDTSHLVIFKAPTLGEILRNQKYRYKKGKEEEEEVIQLEILSEEGVGVLTVTSFIGYDPFQILYKKKLKELFAELQAKQIDKLVIDLRGNRGGSIRNCQKMLGYILTKKQAFFKEASVNPSYKEVVEEKAYEFRFRLAGIRKHSDRLELKSWARKKIKPHRRYGYDGEAILLTDAGSFSAAAIFASLFKSAQRGTIVGSESGGSYYQTFAGFTKAVILPNSRIKVNMPFIRIVHAVDESLQDINQGVIPDIEIMTTLEDYFKDIDPQLEEAIRLLR